VFVGEVAGGRMAGSFSTDLPESWPAFWVAARREAAQDHCIVHICKTLPLTSMAHQDEYCSAWDSLPRCSWPLNRGCEAWTVKYKTLRRGVI
jgi:hypothetical protein